MKEFISLYGMEILSILTTAIAGYLAIAVKHLFNKYLNDKTKQAIAKTVVQAVEQTYTTIHGPEKLNKGIELMTELLNEKGIKASETEMRVLIENAVGEFNKVFEKSE